MEARLLYLEKELVAAFPPVSIKKRWPCQIPPTCRKSFNMALENGKKRDSGVREHMQNWTDQCRTLAGEYRLVIKKQQAFADHDDFSFVGVLAETAPQGQGLMSLGYVAEFLEGKVRTLVLKNFGTQLSFDMMTLGVSTKENDIKSAGGSLRAADGPQIVHFSVRRN
jgi:hypothetical protein